MPRIQQKEKLHRADVLHLLSPNCPGFLPNLARKLSRVRDTNNSLGSSSGISRSYFQCKKHSHENIHTKPRLQVAATIMTHLLKNGPLQFIFYR